MDFFFKTIVSYTQQEIDNRMFVQQTNKRMSDRQVTIAYFLNFIIGFKFQNESNVLRFVFDLFCLCCIYRPYGHLASGDQGNEKRPISAGVSTRPPSAYTHALTSAPTTRPSSALVRSTPNLRRPQSAHQVLFYFFKQEFCKSYYICMNNLLTLYCFLCGRHDRK